MRHASLRRRTVLAIVATAIATSLLFGLTTFIFAYTIEDRLFETELAREIDRQQEGWRQGKRLQPPHAPYIRIYRNGATLPDDLAPQIQAEPKRTEYFGRAGRHYHIARFTLPGSGGGGAVAVAESSRYLLVRPVRNSLIVFLTGLSLVVALVAALIGWWLATCALTPLSRLANDVADADRAVPRIDAKLYPNNEIGVLAHALRESFDRIRGFVAREQGFTRDASHELRTPLAVIGGAAELLSVNPDLPPSARPALRRIETASADMAQALDLLLALARESATQPRAPIALLPLVEKAMASAAARYPGSSVAVTLDIDATAKVTVDQTLLQLVLNNLIGNAHQHASGSVLNVTGDHQQLLIADTGPGLREIGDPFVPFNKHPDSSGSGLGLAIVKRLCDAARIDLTWRGAGNGAGASFQLKFSPA